MRTRSLVLTLIVLSATVAVAGPAREWPQYRGPGALGKSDSAGLFEAPAGVGLRIACRQKLGSGYSGLSISGGRVVAMFTDGRTDIVGFDDRPQLFG